MLFQKVFQPIIGQLLIRQKEKDETTAVKRLRGKLKLTSFSLMSSNLVVSWLRCLSFKIFLRSIVRAALLVSSLNLVRESLLGSIYVISLLNKDLINAIFTNMTFQKIPIPHITCTLPTLHSTRSKEYINIDVICDSFSLRYWHSSCLLLPVGNSPYDIAGLV